MTSLCISRAAYTRYRGEVGSDSEMVVRGVLDGSQADENEDCLISNGLRVSIGDEVANVMDHLLCS